VINLTIPLYPYIPTGNVFQWESPFITEDIATYEKNAARLFYISMGSSTGTRLLSPGLVFHQGDRIIDVALEKLLNRYAPILKLPKKENEVITAKEIEFAFSNYSPHLSDGIILATGWGDKQKWKPLGENFSIQSPSLSIEAATLLMEKMKEIQSDFLLTDCFYLDNLSNNFVNQNWLSQPSWIRLPWPSEMAKAYLRTNTNFKLHKTWEVTSKLLEEIWVVAGLANCGSLSSPRPKISCVPMFIENAGEAPCTVVAE
jgi:kynurenine formamidase